MYIHTHCIYKNTSDNKYTEVLSHLHITTTNTESRNFHHSCFSIRYSSGDTMEGHRPEAAHLYLQILVVKENALILDLPILQIIQ